MGNHDDTPLGRPRRKTERPPPVIPISVFQEAQRDPIVKAFLKSAKARGAKLELEGKILF